MEIAFVYGKRNLPPIIINVKEVSPCDAKIVAYVLSYLIPLTSMALDDYNLWLFIVLPAVFVILAPFVNSAVLNPVLILHRYHFYQVNTKNGVSGYVLISKRKIRNAKDIKRVNLVFEFLLKDVEGM